MKRVQEGINGHCCSIYFYINGKEYHEENLRTIAMKIYREKTQKCMPRLLECDLNRDGQS